MWPQYTIVVCSIISVGVALGRFGLPKKADNYDVIDLLGPFVSLWILYEGGFFAGLG